MSDQSSGEPWFRDGLQFSCTQCGKCCTGAPGFVWLNDAEIESLAAACEIGVPEFLEKYAKRVGRRISLIERPNGDCIFWDRKVGCTVYEQRPRQCRTWPFWESNLKSPDTWEETCSVCPGSGQGRLYTADEIIAQSKMIRI
jgi:Fe-S-cluster containining protein